jgi:hypothetical protein
MITLRLGIHAGAARQGALEFARSAADIRRAAAATTASLDKVEGAFKRLRGSVFDLRTSRAESGLIDAASGILNDVRLALNNPALRDGHVREMATVSAVPDVAEGLANRRELILNDIPPGSFARGGLHEDSLDVLSGSPSGVLVPASPSLPDEALPAVSPTPLFAQATRDAVAWKEEVLAGLDQTKTGYSQLGAEVEAVFGRTIADALRESLRDSRRFSDGATVAFLDYADQARNAGQQARMALGRSLRSMEDALVGFVRSGKLEWRSLVDAMIADLIRLFVRSQILGPLAQALGGAFGGAGLGPQFTGRSLDGLQAAGSFRHGGAFTVAGSGGPDSRLVAFRATPGERVTVTPRGASAPGTLVNVNVINQAGAEIETRERPNDQGGLDLLVVVRRDVEQDILSGGRIGRAIGQTFGASVRPAGR